MWHIKAWTRNLTLSCVHISFAVRTVPNIFKISVFCGIYYQIVLQGHLLYQSVNQKETLNASPNIVPVLSVAGSQFTRRSKSYYSSVFWFVCSSNQLNTSSSINIIGNSICSAGTLTNTSFKTLRLICRNFPDRAVST